MKAKVLSIYDEGAMENTPYIGAEGFSVLVEVDGQRTLFDTGMRGRYLIHNLEFMEIKPDTIDRVVISHNHKSNFGGIWKLIDSRTKPLDVYVNSTFISMKKIFNRPMFDEEQSKKINIHVMEEDTKFSDHLMAVGPFGDLQEFSLVLSYGKGPVVMSSCYHCGVRPVLERVKSIFRKDPHYLIGGLHMKKANQRSIDPIADIIEEYGSPHMSICHCAEGNAITYLRVRFNLKGVDNFYVGTSLEFEVF